MLFGLLYNFRREPEPMEEGAPLGDFLAHGAGMCDATLLQGGGRLRRTTGACWASMRATSTCSGSTTSCTLSSSSSSARWRCSGSPAEWRCSRGTARSSPRASRFASRGSHNVDLLRCSLADAVRPGEGAQRYVRADAYLETMRRAAEQRRMQRRDQGFSDSEYESPEGWL